MTTRYRLSLSQRLLVGLLVVSFAYWAAIAWLTIRDSVDDVYELFDAHLAQTALALLQVADPDDRGPVVIPRDTVAPTLNEVFDRWPHLPERLAEPRFALGIPGRTSDASDVLDKTGKDSMQSLHAEYGKRLRFQIWDQSGRLLLKSLDAPGQPLTEVEGFSESTDGDGQVWRSFSVWDIHFHYLVMVAEAHDLRNRLVGNIALHVVSPLALGLPVLIFLLWFSISRGLDPLAVMTREIRSRKPENLALLDVGSAPGEVRPMVLAINHLLQRITQALASERLFTANAAHELRTPLAAIQAHLHAVRTAEGKGECLRAMDQLQLSVERGIRLVGQLLTLARLDPEQPLPDVRPVDLGEVAEAVCAEQAPLALQRQQTLELRIEPGLPPIPGNADMLSMLFCNLLDNAVRYTQRGGRVDVDVRRHAGGLQVDVCDDGPGIPAEKRAAVFERFYRLAGQDQPGTGLGLAICRRIAELHGARIALADGPRGKGLTVSVYLSTNETGAS